MDRDPRLPQSARSWDAVTITVMNWFKSFRIARAAPTGAVHGPPESMTNVTPRAVQMLALARKEAERFHHNFVGTEHLLLALTHLGQGTAVAVLGKMGLDLETVRMEVEKQVGTGPEQEIIGNIPYTPRVKKVLALAAKEAKALNHNYIGTEHILLGLLLEGDGVAPRVLKNFGVDAEKTRLEILKELDPNFAPAAPPAMPSGAPQNQAAPQRDAIGISKRYDVYCTEGHEEVVYRNALFKARRPLLSTRPRDFRSEFFELEQSNGQTVYVSEYSVRKFCEHGAGIVGEIIRPK